jgi:hypothetical protein
MSWAVLLSASSPTNMWFANTTAVVVCRCQMIQVSHSPTMAACDNSISKLLPARRGQFPFSSLGYMHMSSTSTSTDAAEADQAGAPAVDGKITKAQFKARSTRGSHERGRLSHDNLDRTLSSKDADPTAAPTAAPTTAAPTAAPTAVPTNVGDTHVPTASPTGAPTVNISNILNWAEMKTACGSSGTVTLSDDFVMGTYTLTPAPQIGGIDFSGKQLVIIGNSKTLDTGTNGYGFSVWMFEFLLLNLTSVRCFPDVFFTGRAVGHRSRSVT